jgi:thiamine-phosphate pyrophosphorylase
MRRYYITDRKRCPDLLDCIRRAAADGVELVQIREKDLSARELLRLTEAAVEAVSGFATKILVNSRTDIALVSGAHGVHLPGSAIPAREWRRIVPPGFLIGISCHAIGDDIEAADFAVYGPVFETPGKGPAVGLEALRDFVTSVDLPVFALGGITASNAQACRDAGAAGIAGIRMFQDPG